MKKCPTCAGYGISCRNARQLASLLTLKVSAPFLASPPYPTIRNRSGTRHSSRARNTSSCWLRKVLRIKEIAKTLGTSGNTVGKWRRRFVEKGIRGLDDDPRPGRRRIYGPEKIEEIVKKTIERQYSKDRTQIVFRRSMAKTPGRVGTTISETWSVSWLCCGRSGLIPASHDSHRSDTCGHSPVAGLPGRQY